ncbi:coiled-coil domain-containing protein 110 [Gracilinanus agilis]|uniref:coiled-coil domain-containing protein 110 n=1 Tax=Gracilinanus agilis TaxID=191870 RepID=UPI001CFD2AAA|nr:coiled-coil domain-containing protein 110 [Gracilinanus agilis]
MARTLKQRWRREGACADCKLSSAVERPSSTPHPHPRGYPTRRPWRCLWGACAGQRPDTLFHASYAEFPRQRAAVGRYEVGAGMRGERRLGGWAGGTRDDPGGFRGKRPERSGAGDGGQRAAWAGGRSWPASSSLGIQSRAGGSGLVSRVGTASDFRVASQIPLGEHEPPACPATAAAAGRSHSALQWRSGAPALQKREVASFLLSVSRHLNLSEGGKESSGQTKEHATITETENQNQPQSALKALQHQLESFQALRLQTLQNVSMVQSEISEILNKSIIEVDSPQFNTEKATKKPVEKLWEEQIVTILCKDSQGQNTFKQSTENPEETLSKEKMNHLGDCSTIHPVGENSNSVAGNNISRSVPSQVTFKNPSTLKSQTSRLTSSPDTNTLEKSNLFENHSDLCSFLPFINQICANTTTPVESKSPVPFLKVELGGTLDDVCLSIQKMKDELQRSHERELALANELHMLKNATDIQGNYSNIVLPPKLEKVKCIKKEKVDDVDVDTQSKRILALEALVNKLIPIEETRSKSSTNYCQNCQSLTENEYTTNVNHIARQSEERTEKNNYEIPDTECVKHFQSDSRNSKDTSLIDQAEHEIKDKENQLFELYQGSVKVENEKSPKINPVTDQYIAKIQYLQNYLKESMEVQKKVLGLENENLDLKTKIKPMVYTIQSLMQKNSTYQTQLNDLVEDKKTIQAKLSKSEEDSRECIIELKRIIQKYSELQNVNKILEEKNGQFYLEIQRMMELINQLKIKEEETQSKMSFVNSEVNRLKVEIESLKTSYSVLQNDKQLLDRKACQLQKENCSLQHELNARHLEILELKENERLTKFDQETLLQVIESTKNEKLTLEATLQESTAARQIIEQEVEKIQSYQCDAEEKFLAELQNAKSKASYFKNGLSEMNKECEKLSKMVKSLQSDNQVLKEELKNHSQENLKFAKNISRLTEDKVLLENYLRTVENERDSLKFEVQRQQDYFSLGDVFSNKRRNLTQLTYLSRSEPRHFDDS